MFSFSHHTFILRPGALELVESTPDTHEPVAYAYAGLPAGLLGFGAPDEGSRFDPADQAALREAIASCLKQAGRKPRRAHVAIDGAVLRQLTLPLSYVPSDDELATLVQTEAERYAVFADAEVAFDFHVLKQEGESLSLLFAAFRAELLAAVSALFRAEGVEIESIEPLPLALLRGFHAQVPEAFADGHHGGLLALLPYRLHAASWQDGKLKSWRSIFLDTEGVGRGDPEAIADARMELQRTLLDAPSGRWILADVPPALEAALPLGHFELFRHGLSRPGSAGELARGAAAYTREAYPFALNLCPTPASQRRSFSNRQLATAGGFAAVLVVALLVSTLLDMRVKHLRETLTQLEAESATMQAELQRPDLALAGQQAALAGLTRSAQGAEVFDQIRDAVPHDIWLKETAIQPQKALKLEGYSISRTSPLTFARALGDVPGLANVSMPELRQDKYEGEQVYRFEIQADLAGTERKARD